VPRSVCCRCLFRSFVVSGSSSVVGVAIGGTRYTRFITSHAYNLHLSVISLSLSLSISISIRFRYTYTVYTVHKLF